MRGPLKNHPWVKGVGGRSVKAQPGGSTLATATCSVCRDRVTIRFRNICDAVQMDQKFEQQGFDMKKGRHVACAPKERDKDMATAAPTSAAIKSQIKAMQLIDTHFDADRGVYAKGWSDAKIAAEADMAVGVVAAYREEGFGPLKEPPEIAALANDIAALEALATETWATMQKDVTGLKNRLAELRQKFAA